MDDATYNRLYANYRASQQSPKKKGRGGTVTSLISEVGGAGGAAGGAALGAGIGSIIPGIGTLIGGLLGAGIGGFAGGTGGRLAENKIRDDEYRVGDALEEGLISGVLGTAGQGIGAAAKGLKGAAKVGTAATDDLSRLSKFGLRQESAAKGISPGARVGGKELSLGQADELGRFMSDNFRPGTPIQILEELDPAIRNRSTELANILAKSNRKLAPSEVRNLQKSMFEQVKLEVPTLFTDAGRPSAKLNSLIARFKNAKTAKELDDARKVADSFINFGRNSAKEPEFEQAARVIRDLADQKITELVPDAKISKTFISNALDAQAAVTKAAKPPIGFGGGITNRLLESAPVEGARSVGGRAAYNLGKAAPTLATAGRVAGGTAVRGMANQAMPQEPSLEDALMQNQDYGYDEFRGTGDFGMEMEEPQSQSPYPKENLIYDIQRDPANAAKYIAYFQSLEEVFGVPQEPELTSVQATRAAAAQNALMDIPLIEEAINSGKLGGAKALPGSGTQIGRRILGTENLDAALFNIADNILRARSGAAAPEAEVRRFVQTFLPSATDSPQAKMQKLEHTIRELQGYVNPQAAASGSLEDVLLNLQGAF